MQVHVNANHLHGGAQLQASVGATVAATLERYENLLTGVEVYLADENGQKAGADDKRCQIEARPRGQAPVSVTHKASDFESAIDGAAQKMARALEHLTGRLATRVESTGHLTAPEEDSPLQVDALREDEFLARQARLDDN